MRKISLLIAALALVLGLSQCKKQEEPAASGEKQHIVLNASFGGGNSKIADNGTGGLIWSLNDVIKVSNIGGELGELHCTDAANGTFEGDITASEGQITFTFGTKPDNYTNQTGNLKDAIYLESAKIDYRADGNYGEVKMNMPHAVLKLDLSAFASNDRDGVTVTIQSDDEPLASVLNITPASKAVYVALPIEGNESKKYTFKGNDKIFEKAWTLVANSFYTAKGEGDDPTGDAIVIEPEPEPVEKWLYYDDGTYATSIGGNGTIYWGSMFPASTLTTYAGCSLTQVAVYSSCPCTATLNIYYGGTNAPATLVHSQDVTFSGYNDFDEFTLSAPLPLDGENLWITFYQSGEYYPADACIDTGNANNRWCSSDGSEWMDLAEFEPGYGWMIRGYVTNTAKGGEVVALDPFKGNVGGELSHTAR